MKKILLFVFFIFFIFGFSQKKKTTIRKKSVGKPALSQLDYIKVNDSLPDLIMKRQNGKIGFINQKGKWIISPEYDFGNFFFEDCNLLNSPNSKIQKFGSDQYASVTLGDKDFRIDKKGKRVYQFKKEDLGVCASTYQEPKYFRYNYRGFNGIVDNKDFSTPEDYKSFIIYPQYSSLYILESKDHNNPMIIAEKNGKYGIIDKNNNVIIPFEYLNIKKNFSWRIAHLFEVTQDGENYFFIDDQNNSY